MPVLGTSSAGVGISGVDAQVWRLKGSDRADFISFSRYQNPGRPVLQGIFFFFRHSPPTRLCFYFDVHTSVFFDDGDCRRDFSRGPSEPAPRHRHSGMRCICARRHFDILGYPAERRGRFEGLPDNPPANPAITRAYFPRFGRR